ncbi:DUF411 domain-containing protein [Nostoc sp. TCL26-01]|uniref:DUF411 domain-containing protein n=1 Tax=Nostoc sp. TCL26-01 TaxID=2576904 RepID=UPI0015C000B1|nr:DUF411 domain-containing protein [Nostoc sp. TCL26-01]QLE58540.1 DUF411 domain-containing protein [Nostoc sp. TCL26-01]
MLQKLFLLWRQKLLRSIIIYIFDQLMIWFCLMVGILGVFLSNIPVSHAQVVFSSPVVVTTKPGITDNNQHSQTIPITTVYRSPDCSCCGGWIDHLKSQGFTVKDIPTTNIEAIKHKFNVPDNLTSCHTAIVDGYVIEGHVPAQDIKRLLQEKPQVAGLSVPQMPLGTPGMEIGDKKDPFSVLFFDQDHKVGVFSNWVIGDR